MPYVNERWLGGMLTNFETISKRVDKMLEYERMQASGEFDAMIKKEALLLDRELTKLQRNLGGLREPEEGARRDLRARHEEGAHRGHRGATSSASRSSPSSTPTSTPRSIQYPIPGNDDAIRANSLFARVIADAVERGPLHRQQAQPGARRRPSRSRPRKIAEFEAAQQAAP